MRGSTLLRFLYMNISGKEQPAEKVIEAIVALKDKSEKPAKKDGEDQGVDLVSIVKKLSRNRDKVKRAVKGASK